MNIYIFDYVDNLTENYHPEGGLVVVATTIEQAIELSQANGVQLRTEEIEKVQVYPLKGRHEPKVFIFPDAGCC